MDVHGDNTIPFEHNGEKMTGEQIRKVLEYGLGKGYKAVSELSNVEIDYVKKTMKYERRQ